MAAFLVGCSQPMAPVYHTVTFNTLGGSSVASVQVLDGDTVDQPADPTKQYFNFTGWDKTFTMVVTSDVTVTAIWTETNPSHDYRLVTGSPWKNYLGNDYLVFNYNGTGKVWDDGANDGEGGLVDMTWISTSTDVTISWGVSTTMTINKDKFFGTSPEYHS